MDVTFQVFVLFLVVLTGVLCRRLGYLSEDVIHGLTRLILNVTTPCLVLGNMQRDFSRELFVGFLAAMALAAAVLLIALGLGWALYRRRPAARRAVLANLCGFPNCGFMGYPVILAINPDWMIYAVAYNVAYMLVSWTVGVSLFGGREAASLRRAALNPNIIAAVLSFVFFCLQVRFPAVLSETLELLGGLTTPLTMLLIGTRVCGIRAKDLTDPDYYTFSLLRLALIPLMALLLMRPLPVGPAVRGTVFILSAMPAATMVSMQAELYGGDAVFAARGSAFSTLLSMVSIPLMALLL